MTQPYEATIPLYSRLSPEFDTLLELARDMRWSWSHSTDRLWRELDPVLWDLTHNPWVVLQTVAVERIREVLVQPRFRTLLEAMLEEKKAAADSPGWFQRAHPASALRLAAFFSMEFMLSESLPIYSGGLGNVAGDQLKAGSDLGVPVVGLGLLYQQGCFRQVIARDGGQQTLYPYNDPGQLPLLPARDRSGEWLRIKIALPGHPIWLRVWEAQVGRSRLYLLDSNDSANFPPHRGVTSELYGGGSEVRLKQEIVLGIGGWRVLEALGLAPEVCHLNEGHTALAILERARSFMRSARCGFRTALTATRAGNIFTTHTAQPAAFDYHPPQLVEHFLGNYARDELGIALAELLALGRANPRDDGEYFNMAFLAARGSLSVNAVSRLHADVSRPIFQAMFPRRPEKEVPITYVTNGVHMPSWDSEASDALWTAAAGKSRWLEPIDTLGERVRGVTDTDLWKMRNTNRRALVAFARQRLASELEGSGASPAEVASMARILNSGVLTLGFGRRFVRYKRPNLLLHDPERLLRLLTRPEYPVQLVIAGKAPPGEVAGQAMIKEWVNFVRRSQVRPHAVFLADYDMLLAEQMVQGVDLWLNTPERPREACGTSGMKALVNGVLNISVLDGWWAEAYAPEVGWAIGKTSSGSDDAGDAAELYDLLEHVIIPEFYARDANDIPVKWVGRIRESMARLAPWYSTNRSLVEYTEHYYLPAAKEYNRRAAQEGATAALISSWLTRIEAGWHTVRFRNLDVRSGPSEHLFEAEIESPLIEPECLRVELFADGVRGAAPEIHPMELAGRSPAGALIYRCRSGAERPAWHYTPRALPIFPGVNVALESGLILWQR